AGSGDDANMFGTIPGVTLKTTLGDWRIRGGHRLWHAPEDNPGSYVPDNDSVTAEMVGNTVKLIQAVEQPTGIQKEIWVTLDPTGSHVTVEHRMTNKGTSAVDMACWAMSAMNKGGMAIFPQEPYQSHDVALLPARPVVLWYYTDMSDPRWKFGKSFVTLRQDPRRKEPQKIGILNKQGWAAYARNGMLFLKRFAYEPDKTYPDYDCNNETFTNDVFLELETLGPMHHVDPGQTITYTENWWLFKNVNPGGSKVSIAAALQPILAETSGSK
ncbi:MAG TPA: hypothetical protein VKT32_14820, partial [Chthonomonadaceae bacterium]|nr:hypothetical protein [Chthonomonadaceae bacterium]